MSKEGSIIVVSDVHLGSENSCYESFSHFLEWLCELNNPRILLKDGKEKVLSPPRKLILLGDILELWDPIDDKFLYTLKHFSLSMGKLLELECEKVYVVGNHDEDISDFQGEFPEKNPFLKIVPRHYPESPTNYEEVGKNRYFFIHGHQFDKLFLAAGPLASVPSYMARMSSLTSKYFPLEGWSSVLLFLIFLLGFYIFKHAGFSAHLLALTAISAVFAIPKIFTYLQGSVWKKLRRRIIDRPKYKDIERIVDEGYYKKEKDTIKANIVVYGHTHVPEISSLAINKKLGKMFVNSGSWVREREPYNTWVYIDEDGPILLKWDDSTKTTAALDL